MVPRITGCVTFAILMAGGAWVVVAQAPAAPEELQNTLMAQETQLLNAIEAKDRPALGQLLADQVMAVTVARGRKLTEDHIAAIASLPVKSFDVSEATTISVTPDVAILSFILSWTDSGGETPAKTTVYATVVWKQVDGQWRSVFYQETPIAT